MSKKYLASKKRLLLCLTLSSMVAYTIIGSFPDENKILAIALIPMCLMQLYDWIRRQK
jgi:hypothetical protein